MGMVFCDRSEEYQADSRPQPAVTHLELPRRPLPGKRLDAPDTASSRPAPVSIGKQLPGRADGHGRQHFLTADHVV